MMIAILTYIASIVCNAIGDGLNDDGKKVPSHTFRAAAYGFLLILPFITTLNVDKWYVYLISYMALRVGLFDYTYNATRHLPLNKIGNTSLWDKFLNLMRPPSTLLMRIVATIVGIFLQIQFT